MHALKKIDQCSLAGKVKVTLQNLQRFQKIVHNDVLHVVESDSVSLSYPQAASHG